MLSSSYIHQSPAYKQLQHHSLSTNLLPKFVPTITPLSALIQTRICKPICCMRNPDTKPYHVPVFKSQIKAAKTKQKMAASLYEIQSLASDIITTYRSIASSIILFRKITNEAVPGPVKTLIYNASEDFFRQLFGSKTQLTIVVDELSGNDRNQIYDAVEIYLGSRINPKAGQLRAKKSRKQKSISLSMEEGEEVMDTFKDIQLKWQFVSNKRYSFPDLYSREYRQEGGDKPYYKVMFDSMHKETVVNEYLPFILSKAKEFKEKERDVKLYTLESTHSYIDDGSRTWKGVNLDHPITFDKLAMEPKLKMSIVNDLDRFVRRRDYYKKVGKAWKRGYLLYGPPGTGKSSLIAAMANYLKFDVYDLELSSLKSNSTLRKVLLQTSNKSIIVIEDIDCSSQTLDRDANDTDYSLLEAFRRRKVVTELTLSGLLNVMDGLWSTCGDERIIVLTTNHKDKLDPALLRPGRIDMHIHMGYCTQEGFDALVFNYLGVSDHRLFPDIKRMIREVDITPAEVAEHLMRNEDVDLALEGVLDLLKRKKDEQKIKDEEKEKEATKRGESEAKEKEKKREEFDAEIVARLMRDGDVDLAGVLELRKRKKNEEKNKDEENKKTENDEAMKGGEGV